LWLFGLVFGFDSQPKHQQKQAKQPHNQYQIKHITGLAKATNFYIFASPKNKD
jgi:hypothetical protein